MDASQGRAFFGVADTAVVSAATTTPRGAIWAPETGARLRTPDTRVDAVAHAGTDDPAPGTPGWWRARAARDVEATGSGSGQPRRGRPPRSVERIVEAAAEL